MRTLTPIICAALTLAAGSVYVGSVYAAPAASASAAPAAGTPDTLKKDTIVRLRLDTDLEAGKSEPGDPIQFTVDKDVYGSDHALLLTKGMTATGKVTASTAHDRFGRRGRLTFICKSVQAANGVSVPVNLVVGSGSGAAADAADEMDAQQFYSFRLEPLDPNGYVQSANPNGYYTQPQGSESTTIYDPARQFTGSLKVTAKRGSLYTAHVARDVSVPVAQHF